MTEIYAIEWKEMRNNDIINADDAWADDWHLAHSRSGYSLFPDYDTAKRSFTMLRKRYPNARLVKYQISNAQIIDQKSTDLE